MIKGLVPRPQQAIAWNGGADHGPTSVRKACIERRSGNHGGRRGRPRPGADVDRVAVRCTQAAGGAAAGLRAGLSALLRRGIYAPAQPAGGRDGRRRRRPSPDRQRAQRRQRHALGDRLAGDEPGPAAVPAGREDGDVRGISQPCAAGPTDRPRRGRALGRGQGHRHGDRRARPPRRQARGRDGAAIRPEMEGAGSEIPGGQPRRRIHPGCGSTTNRKRRSPGCGWARR